MKRIAIVIPWFGREARGGAETQARQIASKLAQRGHKVEVLTTCCRSFEDDWGTNHLPAGVHRDENITIRRFPVDGRNVQAFLQVRDRLLSAPAADLRLGSSPINPEDEGVFVEQNIHSSSLHSYVKEHRERYDAIIFIPYLYGTTLKILPDVAEIAFLQPCLHDEPYAYLNVVRNIFFKARTILFNSKGEFHLAMRLYGPAIFSKSKVVGEGIELEQGPSTRLDATLPSELKNAPFVLYLGRRSETKNVPVLLEAFDTFKRRHPSSNLRLVLAGPGHRLEAALPKGALDLGWVDETTKAALLKSCVALFQPSKNESFSRSVMEAWSQAKPVAVNGRCLAMAVAVEESGGGWLVMNEAEWSQIFARIAFTPPATLQRIGSHGRRYVVAHCNGEQVIERYEEALEIPPMTITLHSERRLKAIHQLLPDLAYGDAISNQALAIRDRVRHLGYDSQIFVINLQEAMRDEGRKFVPESLGADREGIIYHHSIGSEITAHALSHRGPKCLVYHNITPPAFFAPYRPGMAWLLEIGRKHLPLLAKHFPISAGDSIFNASELAEAGFTAPMVLPIIVNPDRWRIEEDKELLERLQDGRTNILFVGRISPNKRQDQIIEAFAHYKQLDSNSRLILAGEGKTFDPYLQKIKRRIFELDLINDVILTGHINDSQLMSYYRAAHLFWSFSEHEGFCVPLIEAMWFDVPVLAFKSSAISETVAEAGVLFEDKRDLAKVAALARRLVADESMRRRVLMTQRQRREEFVPEAIWPKLDRIIKRMEECCL